MRTRRPADVAGAHGHGAHGHELSPAGRQRPTIAGVPWVRSPPPYADSASTHPDLRSPSPCRVTVSLPPRTSAKASEYLARDRDRPSARARRRGRRDHRPDRPADRPGAHERVANTTGQRGPDQDERGARRRRSTQARGRRLGSARRAPGARHRDGRGGQRGRPAGHGERRSHRRGRRRPHLRRRRLRARLPVLAWVGRCG